MPPARCSRALCNDRTHAVRRPVVLKGNLSKVILIVLKPASISLAECTVFLTVLGVRDRLVVAARTLVTVCGVLLAAKCLLLRTRTCLSSHRGAGERAIFVTDAMAAPRTTGVPIVREPPGAQVMTAC